MKPIEHIRKSVFGVSQAVFGEIAGTTQASVSRWENGDQEPSQGEMNRIRDEARARALDWDDRWFFEIPPPRETPSIVPSSDELESAR